MLDDLTLRRSAIAYVYPENPQLRRQDNLAFFDRVGTSGVELPSLSMKGPGRELVLMREPTTGGSGLEIRVGPFGPNPRFRFLVAHLVGDDPVQVTRETADLSWQAFQAVWGNKTSEPTITEVTLEASVPAPGGKSRDFLRGSVTGLGTKELSALGREYEGFGLRFLSGPAIHFGDTATSFALPGAQVELRIETLVEPPMSQLFLQAKVRWPQINVRTDQLPSPLRKQVQSEHLQLNKSAKPPTFYLETVYRYLTENVLKFVRSSAG